MCHMQFKSVDQKKKFKEIWSNMARIALTEEPNCLLGSQLKLEADVSRCAHLGVQQARSSCHVEVYYSISGAGLTSSATQWMIPRRPSSTSGRDPGLSTAQFQRAFVQFGVPGGQFGSLAVWQPGLRYVSRADLDGPHQKSLDKWKAKYGEALEALGEFTMAGALGIRGAEGLEEA